MTEPTTAAGQDQDGVTIRDDAHKIGVWIPAWAYHKIRREHPPARQQEPRHTEGQGDICDSSCPHWGWAEARQQDGSALRDPWIMAGDHPESSCGRCGHANVWSWSAPSPLWNAVMRDPENGADAYGVVCPPCFSELASLKGLGGKPLDGLPRWSWRFAPEIPDEEIAALWADRDGRVWDPETWLWTDLAALPPSAPPARPGGLNVLWLAMAIDQHALYMAAEPIHDGGTCTTDCAGDITARYVQEQDR